MVIQNYLYKMKVLKFGGTSVSSVETVNNISNILAGTDQNTIVVFSALSKVTNMLTEAAENAASGKRDFINIADQILLRHFDFVDKLLPQDQQADFKPFITQKISDLKKILESVFFLGELSTRAYYLIVSFGEIMSNALMYRFLTVKNGNVGYLDSSQIIITRTIKGKEVINRSVTYQNIVNAYDEKYRISVAPGFISKSENGYATTLGRGGSDFTAALYAAALNAELLEIWTDVSGIYTSDPRKVKGAYPCPAMSYREALELSNFGAKVIYAPTIQPVLEKNIPMVIKNTFRPDDAGTLVTDKVDITPAAVKAFSTMDDIAMLTFSGTGLVGTTGIAGRLFQTLSVNGVNIIIITQASSEQSICMVVEGASAQKAVDCVNNEFAYEIRKGTVDTTVAQTGFSVLAMVGEGMKSAIGLSGKAFSALGRNGVNIHAIAQGSSEINISLVIKKQDAEKALNVLHEAFFLSEYRTVNLFVAGIGNVGGALLSQISKQENFFKDQHRIIFKLSGVANSKKMYFDASGINADDYHQILEAKGVPSDIDKFVSIMSTMNLGCSIFVDNTASKSIADIYSKVLEQNISVVTCNKTAASGDYHNFEHLKELALSRNVFFRYESNVGAGLPVINTIDNLVKSGDIITGIEAVLSGSMNFILNRFHDGISFADAVKEAIDAGFTEPDPRIDLNGRDVMRKILILMREAGLKAEISDVIYEDFMPEDIADSSDKRLFIESLKSHNDYFEKLKQKYEHDGCRMRFLARFSSEGARVGLVSAAADSPYYNLEGKDNIIIIHSRYYKESPLVITGAGAGAQVTASGIFSDIISVVNS